MSYDDKAVFPYDAACGGMDPAVFFPPQTNLGLMRPADIAAAARVCVSCPVRQRCFEYAMDNAVTHGIYSGTSPAYRRRLRRVRRQEEMVSS